MLQVAMPWVPGGMRDASLVPLWVQQHGQAAVLERCQGSSCVPGNQTKSLEVPVVSASAPVLGCSLPSCWSGVKPSPTQRV